MHTLLVPGQKGFLLSDIGRLIHRIFEEKAMKLGYSRAQWQVLSLLTQQPGMTQISLAHLMEIEPITLSRHIDKMEREQLLERRADPKDRRVNRLFLNELNTAPHLKRIEGARDEVLQCVFDAVPNESEEMFRAILVDIRKNLMDAMQNETGRTKNRDSTAA